MERGAEATTCMRRLAQARNFLADAVRVRAELEAMPHDYAGREPELDLFRRTTAPERVTLGDAG